MKFAIALYCCCVSYVFCFGQDFIASNNDLPFQSSFSTSSSSFAEGGRWEFSDLFDDVEYFEDGAAVWQLGFGLRSDINLAERAADLDQLDVKFLTPALSLTYDKNLKGNFGLGVILGGQLWRVPIFKYQYRYYTGGLRLSYHFNIIEELDPYIGFGGTFRYLELSNNETNTHNTKVTAHWLIGARYYYSDKWGAFFEAGNDSPTWFKVGLTRHVE